MLRNTMAQVALLRRPDDRINALRDTMSELLGMDEPRRRFAAMMSGLDIHYDFGEGHPLLGRRMPDLDLVTAKSPLRVFMRTNVFGVDQLNPIRPWRNVQAAGLTEVEEHRPGIVQHGSFRLLDRSLRPPPW